MMDQSSKYHLAFDNFEASTSNAFQNLLTNRDFTDVTLACEDDGQVQAHKVILSSMSSFFHKILLKNPHQHPLIYLKGIKLKDLEKIMNFIYMGETEVAKEDLENFMISANELEINGLQTNENNRIDETLEDDQFEILKELGDDLNMTDKFQASDLLDVKTEEVDESNIQGDFGDRSLMNEETKADGPETFNCDQCDFKTIKKGNINRHLAKHEGKTIQQFGCDECDKQCNSNEALKYHKKSVHDGIRFPCDHCAYKATTPQALKKHGAIKHTNKFEI